MLSARRGYYLSIKKGIIEIYVKSHQNIKSSDKIEKDPTSRKSILTFLLS